MFRVLFILLVTLFASSSFGQKIELVNSGLALQKGKSLYDSGKYEEAIKEFYKIAERDTNYALMLSEAALTFIAAEKYDDALRICEKGLSKPSRYTPYFLRYQAVAEDKRGNFENSVSIFQKAITEYPADYGLLYNLGVTYYNNKHYEKAADVFFKVLSFNPFHAGSHLNLGRIAIGQGRKVHGMMSIGMYLSISNTDNTRLVLLNNFLDNQVTDEGTIPPFGPNQPGKLDQIIRAKMAMDKNFKSEFPVDAAVVRQFEMFFRQMQLLGEETEDPWIKTYLPIYKLIRDKGFVAPFIYHILSSAANKDVKKWRSKNDKELKSFFAAANEIIKKQREVVSLDGFGYPAPVQAWYNDDNTLSALGEYAADKRRGHWKYYFTNYQLSAEGDYNTGGEKKGVWKYYNEDGTLKSVENYDTGEVTAYYSDGTTREHFFLRDDKIDGDVELYFPCGPLKEKLTYKNGQRQGKGQTYYAAGGTDMSYQYEEDKAQGEFKTFYPNGKIKTLSNYKDDKLHGLYQSYHPNEQLAAEGSYLNGELAGNWTSYYSNGKIERKGSYNDSGKPVGKWTYYDRSGNLTEERLFDAEGRLEGPNTHYFENKIHYVDTYRKDILVESVFYDRTGKEIVRQGNGDGTFAARNYFSTGQLQSEGSYKKGKLEGLWRYFNRFGKLISEYHYRAGLLQGSAAQYYSSGEMRYALEYKDDVLHGYFQEFYKHGPVKQEGWFQNGNREQQWFTYFSDGSLETDSYYLRNSLTGSFYSYSPDGKLQTVSTYDNDRMTDLKNYDSKGNAVTVQTTTDNHVQIFEERFPNKKVRARFELLCGNYVNDFKKWYPDGSLYYSVHFINGEKFGPYTHFEMNGKPVMEGVYLGDAEEGQWKFFNERGKLIREGRYVNGLKDSVWNYYYGNGEISSTLTYRNDELDGLARYFSPAGTPIMEKMYVEDDLVAYRNINGMDEEAQWQEFSGTDTFLIKNAAGTVVYEEQYLEGLRHGQRRTYYNNGNLCEEYHYSHGDLEGPYAQYYLDGNVSEKGTFKNDVLHGKVEYFLSDGTPLKVENFTMGVRDGQIIYYTGKSRKEFTVWNGMME